MKELLEDLKALLEKHNAAIVRSAGSNHELVLCKVNPGGRELDEELTFDEDITQESIKWGWYHD